MDKLELIKTAHVIDRGLGTLSASVTAEPLKRRIGALHAEWQDLTYSISAHLAGAETDISLSARKRGRRKKPLDPAEPQAQSETPDAQAGDGEQGGV